MNQEAEKFLKTLDRAENTRKSYASALRRYFDTVGDKMSDEAYENFLSSLSDLSPSSKRVVLSAVMGLYEFCEIGDPSRRARLNKHYARKGRTKPVNFNRDEIEIVLSYCEKLSGRLVDLRDRAFVLTMADSGFRISELTALKRGDVDWREERVMITGKGDKTAVVRLSKRSVAALKEYLSARASLDGSSGKPLNTLPLFTQHGRVNRIKAMTIDGMRKAIKSRMDEAGVDHRLIRLHDFRHYFVTMAMIAKGLKTAQELARHESMTTTQRYAHFASSELDEQYDEIFNKK